MVFVTSSLPRVLLQVLCGSRGSLASITTSADGPSEYIQQRYTINDGSLMSALPLFYLLLTLIERAPACHQARTSSGGLHASGKTHRCDAVGQYHWWCQLHEGYIVVKCLWVELQKLGKVFLQWHEWWGLIIQHIFLYKPYRLINVLERYLRMRDDAIHFKELLIGVSLGDVKISHHSSPVALTTAAAEVREGQPRLENVYLTKTRDAHIPGKTMSRSHNPGTVHQDPATHQSTI